jgi:hypothetical protein
MGHDDRSGQSEPGVKKRRRGPLNENYTTKNMANTEP